MCGEILHDEGAPERHTNQMKKEDGSVHEQFSRGEEP
jgi:hypothetical protein